MVSLPASNRARLPAGGIEAVVKETVDKRKKPETVTTHNNQTTTKKIKEKKGGVGQRKLHTAVSACSLMPS